jgi:hypothetical protein
LGLEVVEAEESAEKGAMDKAGMKRRGKGRNPNHGKGA